MSRLGHRAVVVGGSIAGLLAARVLSDHFDRVVILERDAVKDRPALHRSVDRLQVDDREVQRLVAEVFHLVRPLSALSEEPLRGRVLARI